MTYRHALQYLEGDGSCSAVQTARRLRFRALFEVPDPPTVLLFSADRIGLAAAALCRAALLQAGICVGEIADESVGALSDTLRIDGTPIPIETLCTICDTAKKEERALIRDPSFDPPPTELETAPGATYDRTLAFNASDRCGAVLPRLFADAGCRVILLVGDTRSYRLRDLAASAAHTVTVLSGGESRPLPPIRRGEGETISPTCGRAMFRRISDACARAGSRLTLTVTSELSRRAVSPASQTFTYRSISECRLLCGMPAALRAAMLAIEAITALRRFGISPTDDDIRAGFSQTVFPLHFSFFSIQPPVICDRITDADDAAELAEALTEFSDRLPHPFMLFADPSLPRQVLAPLVPLIDEAADDPVSLFPSVTPPCGTLLLVGGREYLEKTVTLLDRRIRPR